jgi:deoxyadenosine/deoxycytidine kinase
MPVIVSIEGSIGAGKSTTIDFLRSAFAAGPYAARVVFLVEPIELWTAPLDGGDSILKRFYKAPREHAFALQTLVYTTVRNQLRAAIHDHPECDVIVCERSAQASTRVFAEMLADSGEFPPAMHDVYRMICRDTDAADAAAARLDHIVFLAVPPADCLLRIIWRARAGEENISLAYLEACEAKYHAWLAAPDAPTHTAVTALDPVDAAMETAGVIMRFIRT